MFTLRHVTLRYVRVENTHNASRCRTLTKYSKQPMANDAQ